MTNVQKDYSTVDTDLNSPKISESCRCLAVPLALAASLTQLEHVSLPHELQSAIKVLHKAILN